MENQIEQIEKRTSRYYYEDGIVELGVGLLFALIGAVLLLIDGTRQGSALALVGWLALMVVTGGGVYGVQWEVRQLKERITYPRTGYVAYPDRPNKGRYVVVASAFALALVVLLLPYEWADKMSLIVGALLLVIHTFIGGRLGLPRMHVVGIIALLVGFLAALFNLGDIPGVAATFGGTGLALMLSGGVALAGYLRANPSAEGDHE
jgi:hypothetical protein